MGVFDWLLVAGSVVSVEVDTIRHDPSYGWCAPADEYREARDVLLRRFVHDFSVFSLTWGAVESAIDVIEPPAHPDKSKRGKIRDACHLLRTAFDCRASVPQLADEVLSFREAAQRCIGLGAVEMRFAHSDIGTPGIGLFAVYELRNRFAHGSLVFPVPDGENRPISEHGSMVQHATRIVLLELQMLLLAYFGESSHLLSSARSFQGACHEAELWYVLRSLHLEPCDPGGQHELPF